MDTVSRARATRSRPWSPASRRASAGARAATPHTGRGCAMVAHQVCARLGLDPRRLTAAVQGFGNVGSIAARLMARDGFSIRAVSDAYGGIHSEVALDIPAVVEHTRRTGSVVGFPGARPVTNAELLELPVDVLVRPPWRTRLLRPTPAGSRRRWSSRGPMAPPPPTPRRSWSGVGSPSSPTSSPTPAGSSSRTSSGFRICNPSSGASARSTSAWGASSPGPSTRPEASERLGVSLRLGAYAVAVQRVADATSDRGIFP